MRASALGLLVFLTIMWVDVTAPAILESDERTASRKAIISKQDADYIFSLTKPEWETYAKRMVVPEGRVGRLVSNDTGTVVIMLDPSTGTGLSIQPLYRDDSTPPDILIVNSYYPLGTFGGVTDQEKQNIESRARRDLGEGYSVSASYSRKEPYEVVGLSLTRVGDKCLFQEIDDTGSMAICFTDIASYSFAEAVASIRERSTGEAREALPEMKKEGIDIDARCLITITSKKLNWSDLPNDFRGLSLSTAGKQMSAIGFYGTGSSPESGVFGVPVNCHVLQEILSAGSVTLTWSSQKGEYSFSFSDESVPGFRQALGHVVESAKSRN